MWVYWQFCGTVCRLRSRFRKGLCSHAAGALAVLERNRPTDALALRGQEGRGRREGREEEGGALDPCSCAATVVLRAFTRAAFHGVLICLVYQTFLWILSKEEKKLAIMTHFSIQEKKSLKTGCRLSLSFSTDSEDFTTHGVCSQPMMEWTVARWLVWEHPCVQPELL